MLDPACHVLAVVLARHFPSEFACTIEDVVKIVRTSDYPMPVQAEDLCRLSEALSARTKILFLRNRCNLERSWIVLDIYSLLHDVNGKIFAPEGRGFSESVFKPTSTGILSYSQLASEFPNLDPFLIVTFLRRLEFCQYISDSEVLGLIKGKAALVSPPASGYYADDVEADSPTARPPVNKLELERQRSLDETTFPPGIVPPPLYQRSKSNPGDSKPYPCMGCSKSSTFPLPCASGGRPQRPDHLSDHLREEFLFFPSLISPEQPKQDMWIGGDFEYYFGWCLRCVNDRQFFSLRFVHTLLLRLSLSFALKNANFPPSPCRQVTSRCTLWKNGLRWLDLDGIETIVEVVEDRKAVLLLMRTKKAFSVAGLHLRSAVIRKILDTKEEYAMQVATCESVIDPSHLRVRHAYPVINQPVEELKRYKIPMVAEAFCFNSKSFLLSKQTY